jgi:hypothetical protein
LSGVVLVKSQLLENTTSNKETSGIGYTVSTTQLKVVPAA